MRVRGSVVPITQDRPDVVERRTKWCSWAGDADARRLIFVDEPWAKTNMTHLRGRASRGKRQVDKIPHGHWMTTTLIAALGVQEMRCSTVVDAAVNRDVFVQQVQAAHAHPCPPHHGGPLAIHANSSRCGHVFRCRKLLPARRVHATGLVRML